MSDSVIDHPNVMCGLKLGDHIPDTGVFSQAEDEPRAGTAHSRGLDERGYAGPDFAPTWHGTVAAPGGRHRPETRLTRVRSVFASPRRPVASAIVPLCSFPFRDGHTQSL